MIIDGDTIVEQGGIKFNGMFFSVFCCLWFTKERTIYMLEEQLRVNRDPKLNIKKDVSICDDR